jgi:DNA replication and repair protein RecF
MHLRTIYLHNFRLYNEAVFDFCPGINTICGENAQGKTSLLEAIYFLITGRSFRTTHLSDLIRIGESFYYIEATFLKHGIEQRLRVSYDGKERKVIFNNTLYHATSSLLGLLQGVLVTPDDLSLIKGGPQVRRHFLDLQIAQVDPLYVHHLTRYNRAMRQRNCLLRAKDHVTLDSWEHEMANAAAYLIQQRFLTISDLQYSSRGFHKTFSAEKEDLCLTHKTTAPEEEELALLRNYYLVQFLKMRRREMELGCTLTGPHKDDFTIAIGEKETRYFASEGQQRSCVAALRFAEWERLKRLGSALPLMLIDDVGVSLDSSRREKLLGQLEHLGQVFLTATEEQPLSSMTREQKVIRIIPASS